MTSAILFHTFTLTSSEIPLSNCETNGSAPYSRRAFGDAAILNVTSMF
jgi:hypothetical protein